MQILISDKKDTLNKIVIENRINVVNHLYCIVLDIKKLNLVIRKFLRKTRVVNLYDNKISNGCI